MNSEIQQYRWEEKDGFQLSNALRAKRVPNTYAHEHSEDRSIQHKLAEGQLHFGPPDEYRQIMNDPRFIEECIIAGSEYREPNLAQGIEFVRERFEINTTPYIVFSEGGSDRILKQISSLFSSSGTTSVKFLGPCFPNIVNFARQTQDRNARKGLVRIGETTTTLGQTMDQTIEKEINTRPLPENKVFYLCNPTTPTGEVVDPDLLERFATICAKTGNTLIIDEAFGDVLPDSQSAIKYTQRLPNLIVTRSLSKILGLAGERIGYAVMSPNEGEKFENLRKIEAYDISAPKQLLINRIMNPEILIPHAQRNAQRALVIKKALLEAFEEKNIQILPTDERVPITTISGGTTQFYNAVIAQGVEAVNGAAFHTTHSEMSSKYVRIANPPTLGEVDDLAERLRAAYYHENVILFGNS